MTEEFEWTEETEQKYRDAIKRFYKIYRPLQRRYNLRMWSRTSIYEDGFIKIHRYEGEVKKELICQCSETLDWDLYNRAADNLEQWARKMEVKRNG